MVYEFLTSTLLEDLIADNFTLKAFIYVHVYIHMVCTVAANELLSLLNLSLYFPQIRHSFIIVRCGDVEVFVFLETKIAEITLSALEN